MAAGSQSREHHTCATLTDGTIETTRIESLLMAEVEADAWETPNVNGEPTSFAWWHEGAPDWYEGDADAEYRTAVIFGFSERPKLAGWVYVESFGLGERACPWCAPDIEERPAIGAECQLCECTVEPDRGGFIYLGEDGAQAIYRRRRVAPNESAYLTEDGFRIEAYGALYRNFGLRIIDPAGAIVFDCPFYLSSESWGTDSRGEMWSAKRWQEELEADADSLLEALEEAA